ncbi:MAG: hypothetical protein PVH31_02725 [Ectothiorhodospiraceae bacterium]|jgi:hypothetical protein
MTDGGWITLIALGEFALLASIGLSVLIGRGLRRRRADHAASDALARRVREAAEDRQRALQELLELRGDLDGSERDDTIVQALEAEGRFYDHLIRTYMHRDAEGIRSMDTRLEAVLQPYRALATRTVEAGAPLPAEAGEDEPATDDRAAAPNRALKQELDLYHSALNRLFAEYTAMFGITISRDSQLTAQEIIQRLDSGRLDGDSGEDDGETDEATAEAGSNVGSTA